MTQPYKTCPQCGQPAVLAMPQCGRCGRVYRTTGAQQTQVIFPVAPPDTTRRDIELDALEREYRGIVHASYALIFLIGLPTGGLGLLCGLFLWSRMNEIKRRVAALGIAPEMWESPLKTWSLKVLGGYLLGAAALLVIAFALFAPR